MKTQNNEYEYLPIVIELKENKENILKTDPKVIFSSNIDYPKFEYGFQHFIHATKNKTEKTYGKFEGKKKVYHVFNKFERYVDNYDKNIDTLCKQYFDIDLKDKEKSKPNILSRGFFKLWEILFYFDIIDIKKDDFISAHLAEGPGSFIQATMFYRDMFCKKGLSKNDKYYAVTLHKEDDDANHIPQIEDEFTNYYAKEKPQRFILHKTHSLVQSGGSKKKDNGDITDPKTLKLFGGEIKEKVDFITGDGGFEWSNENTQEQESYRLILSQIISAIKLQKKNGCFVCKFFETFTLTSLKMLSILTTVYDKVYLVKPLTSRESNSEKYAVCMNFKYDEKNKEYKDIIKKLDEIFDAIHKEKKNHIVDIFSDFELSKDFIVQCIEINRTIANEQFKVINNILDFINKEIYSGDAYHENRNIQIKCANIWTSLFLPKTDDFSKSKKSCENIITKTTKTMTDNIKELKSKII